MSLLPFGSAQPKWKNGMVAGSITNKNNGNVGIGTTGPTEKLVVSGGNLLVAPASWGKVNIRDDFWGMSGAAVGGGQLRLKMSNSGSSTMTFGVTSAGEANDYTALMTIKDNGNVGIGTTNPGALLDLGLAGSKLGVVRLAGSTSGNVSLQPNPIAGAGIIATLPATTGTIITSGDSGTVTGTMIASSVALAGSPTTSTQTAADNSTKVATTAYVDSAVLGQNFKEAVRVVTTAALVGVYVNGASGVGATFTYTATGVDTIDGVALALGDRVLLKNQTADLQNGLYTVTTAGALGVAGILTRGTDADQPTDFKTGDSVFTVAGTTLSTTTWAYNGINSPTLGTTSLTYTQTAGQGSLTAGNGIAITGVSIAIDTAITVDKTTVQTLTNKTLTSPTLTTPALGVATATSINGVSITGSGTVAVGTKSLTMNNTMTLAAGAESQTWTFPSTSDTVVVLGVAQTLTNKTITDSTNNVMAKSLKSATTTIDVSTATAPTAGQVLMATAGTTATWKSSPGEDGWTPVTDTWIYTSANSITVPTGAASKYQKGDRIKWTQTTVKYGVVIAVADTLLTIAITTDYVFTNAAISLPSYSHQAHPLGYPSSFAYTATYTGFSPALTTTGYFSISGNICIVIVSPATGTSNSTNMTISLPVTASATSDSNSASRVADAGGFQITPGMAAIGASVSAAVLSLNFQGAAASFTATGAKGASLNTSYFI